MYSITATIAVRDCAPLSFVADNYATYSSMITTANSGMFAASSSVAAEVVAGCANALAAGMASYRIFHLSCVL